MAADVKPKVVEPQILPPFLILVVIGSYIWSTVINACEP